MGGRNLDDWITSYMKYVENSEPPDSFKKWVAISTVAACLQRKCYLEWEGTLYPNLYIVLVGPSGSRKGTAMRPAEKFLRELGIKLSPEAVTREQLIRRLKKAGDQIVTTSGKVIMHASLTIFSAELTVFLGYNNQQLMADLSDWFDCRDVWKYETKSMGIDNITNVWVNLIGATTPQLLQTTLPEDAIGGGLASRIIFVYEEGKGKYVVFPFKTEEEHALEEKLLHDLEAIKMLEGEFIPDKSFLERWENWYGKDTNKMLANNPRFDGYMERRATHVLKLSMVMNASRDGDMVLTAEDFDRALRELRDVEKKMHRTFLGVGRSDISGVTRAVMTTIIRHKRISFNELLGIHYDDVDYDTLVRIWNVLLTIEKDGRKFFRLADSINRVIEYIGDE